MNICTHCNKEITEEGDFCGNCGYIKFNDSDNIFHRLIKQLKYMFINPVTFIRTSRLINPIFTITMVILIALIELISIKILQSDSYIDIPIFYAIFTTFAIAGIEALFMFLISNFIFKNSIKYISFFNLVLAISTISFCFYIVATLLGAGLSPIFFALISIFGNIVCLLLMYQGIKDFFRNNIKATLITILCTFLGTSLVLVMIIKIILKNALRSIF